MSIFSEIRLDAGLMTVNQLTGSFVQHWVQDLYPIVKYYLEATGQKLVDDPDAVSGATFKADATSEASTKLEAAKEEKEVDSTTSASE